MQPAIDYQEKKRTQAARARLALIAQRIYDRYRPLLFFIASTAIAFASWQFLSTYVLNPFLVPPPLAVIKTAIPMIESGEILRDVEISMTRVLVGFVTGSLAAIVLGVLLGRLRMLNELLDPIIELMRYLSPTAMIPIAVIWFGIGETSKVLVIFLAMLAPIALSTASGVRSVSQERLNAARAFDASRRQLVRFVVLPHTLPSIFTGVRIALGAGWTTLVAAELVAATRGLGFMIQSAAQFLVTDVVIMGIIVIALIAFAFELSLRKLESVLVPWAGRD